MKILARIFALAILPTVALAPAVLHAQDGPPPPPDQGPPPTEQDQGAPPDQGPAPQDQGGDQDDQGASFQTFYDQLGDQGQWVQTDDYGYVFQPNVSDANWAPYTDGHWVYSDVGWTWVSDEPWGWATYHYGRWCNIDGTGWCWVPGYRWAPAWVSWRYGGGYCGWAPLPPETFVGSEYGGRGGVGIYFHFGSDSDRQYNIGPGCYNFVHVGDFGERNYRGHYIDRSTNYTVINNTTNITNINVRGSDGGRGGNFRGISNGGPAFADINAHSREHIQRVQLTQADRAGRSTINGNSLAVFAPRVNPGTQHTARPTHVGQTINRPTFNRGDSISKPMDVTSTVRPPAPSQEAIAAARAARQKEPAGANIANEHTTIKTPITAPLNSMQPVEQHQHQHYEANTAAVPGNNAGGQTAVVPHHDSAFTGEAPATHPQAQVVPHTATGNAGGNSAFTGEPQHQGQGNHPEANPASTFHPQTQQQPGQGFHPQAHPQTQQQPGQTFHPQTQTAPVTHTQQVENPAATTHSPSESQGGNGGQVFHQQNQGEFRPSQEPPTQPSFHSQNQGSGNPQPTFHQQQQANPQPTFHQQQQANPQPTFHQQQQASPTPMFHQQQSPMEHPQAAPQPQHQSAPAQPQHSQGAPAAAPHSAPAQGGGGNGGGGNKSANGNGNGSGNPQGH